MSRLVEIPVIALTCKGKYLQDRLTDASKVIAGIRVIATRDFFLRFPSVGMRKEISDAQVIRFDSWIGNPAIRVRIIKWLGE